MKNLTLLTMLLLAATLTFTACAPDGGTVTYEIGETGPSGVGIVFYVTDGGLHGLEAAPEDQSSSAQWSNVTNGLLGTTGTAIGTGSTNTNAIIGQTCHDSSAAQICRDYRAAEEGDWFLPSKDELDELYDNKEAVGGFANTPGYCSSSEYDATDAWAQDFHNGDQDGGSKDINTPRVRAVRAF
ncbi:MAG: DUF1566 domain-containing protein [Spirochaetia bacterium]